MHRQEAKRMPVRDGGIEFCSPYMPAAVIDISNKCVSRYAINRQVGSMPSIEEIIRDRERRPEQGLLYRSHIVTYTITL
jgi:hypothetical protein